MHHSSLRLIIAGIIGLFTLCQAQPPAVEWSRLYGDTAAVEVAYSLIQTSDLGYAISGSSNDGTAGDQVFVLRLDANGDSIWSIIYGSDSSETSRSICQTDDGGFLTVGYTRQLGSNDILVVRLDSSGQVLWDYAYGDERDQAAYEIRPAADGNFWIGGYTATPDSGDQFYLLKCDQFGDTLWSRTYGGASNEQAYSVDGTTDGGCILAGGRDNGPAYVVKTDEAGNVLWAHDYYGGVWQAQAKRIRCTNTFGYIFSGWRKVWPSEWQYYWEVYVRKLNDDGDPTWAFYCEGLYGAGSAVLVNQDYSYVLGGLFHYSESSNCLRLSPQGLPVWEAVLEEWSQPVVDLVGSADTGYTVLKRFHHNSIGWQVVVAHTMPDTALSAKRPHALPSDFTLSVFPNPFNSSTRLDYDLPLAGQVNLAVYDLNGRLVKMLEDRVIPQGRYTFNFDGAGMASGVYFVRLEAREMQRTQKIVLLK